MPQYIADNTDDELSYAAFLNAYLISRGEEPVDLDAFRTLPSSQATGANNLGRLTNLMRLSVDLSWYARYRSSQNPDFRVRFKGPFEIQNEPGIPLNDTDTPPDQAQPVPPPPPRRLACRPSQTRQGSTLHSLSKVVRASILSWLSLFTGVGVPLANMGHQHLGKVCA
jgi:hypothetical protein